MKIQLKRIAILVFCLAMPCAGQVGAERTKYAQAAAKGAKTLQAWYVPSTGVYAPPAGWWNAANAITVLANLEKVSGERSYDSVFSQTFTAAQTTSANFVNKYYDDDGWWALAWMDAYDVTGERRYLSMADRVFVTMTGGWDTATCGGGIWWSTDRHYKNAIANELFLSVAARLANRSKGRKRAEYRKWAELEWKWFKASGMINNENLVNDGLNSTNPNACINNGRRTWSYNQGVILDGLVELGKANKDATLGSQADAIAQAAIAHLATENGVLTEPVAGKDAPQFKGIFMRNLMTLYKASKKAQREVYRRFAQVNAESILNSDEGPGGAFGGNWQGPFDSGDASRQASALDALVAAAAMQ